MNQINVLDSTGHTRVKWNPKVPEEVNYAREVFDAMKAKGHAIFKVDKEGRQFRMREFDPEAKRMVMVPHMVGG